MDQCDDIERDTRHEEAGDGQEGSFLEHNVHDKAEEGQPSVAAPGAWDPIWCARGLQPLVLARRARRMEPGDVQAPCVHGI